jgi:hypothetical protein
MVCGSRCSRGPIWSGRYGALSATRARPVSMGSPRSSCVAGSWSTGWRSGRRLTLGPSGRHPSGGSRSPSPMVVCGCWVSLRCWTGWSSRPSRRCLEPIFDPGFSQHSYGFRPGRSAHQAVEAARGFIEDGYRWVVDVDLERFFDRVNHDKLMHRVARRVADKRLLRLVRAYIEAGVMVDGVGQPTTGHPAGVAAVAVAVQHHAGRS